MLVQDHKYERGSRFQGEFCVSRALRRTSKTGTPYMVVHLADATGGIQAYCWPEQYQGPENLSQLNIVRVAGTLRPFQNKWQVVLKRAEVVAEYETNPALLVPADICPRKELLLTLAAVSDEISSPALRAFVRSVLGDGDIIWPFVTVPASVKHHHCYPAGTLEHSLECVQIVRAVPYLSDNERDIAVVAALFHDIGKIRTNRPGALAPAGFWIHHNCLTLEVLGGHLRRLDSEWFEAGLVLRHIWSFLHKGPTRSRIALAGLVAYADQYSAERAQEKEAFAGKEPWRTSARDSGGNYRMRLAA